jgi:putative hydrolase of the HAD superfamily
MHDIKNIIFDLGGVIINLDYNKTKNAFVALGLSNFDTIYSQSQQNGFFDAFDKGQLSPEEFRAEIRKHLSVDKSNDEIDAAWDAMLLDVPKEKLDLLNSLKKTYRTYLLSNTNTIHVKNFSAALKKIYRVSDFSGYFEKCYYSCDIGMRKPDSEIFEFVLNENGLRAEETLFIDDSIQHIEGATRCGLQTIHHQQSESLESALRMRGLI